MDALIVAAVIAVVFMGGAVVAGLCAAAASHRCHEAGDLDGGPGS